MAFEPNSNTERAELEPLFSKEPNQTRTDAEKREELGTGLDGDTELE